MNKYLSGLLLIFIISVKLLSAQKGYGEIRWTTSTQPSLIPDSLKNEDAVMIYKKHVITNIYDGRFSSAEVIYYRVKLLTEHGVDLYSKISLTKNDNQKITQLDARTIKANGKVIDLKSSEIKQMDFEVNKVNDLEIQHYRFSIPGVEVGDEIEYGFAVESTGLIWGKDIFLGSAIPCLSSSFSYSTQKGIVTNLLAYNGLHDAQIQSNATDISYSWTINNIAPGGEDEARSIPTQTLPFISLNIQSINLRGMNIRGMKTWDDIYESYDKRYPAEEQEFIYGFIKKRFGKKPDPDSAFVDFIKLFTYIHDSIKVVKLEESKGNEPLEYYLTNHKIDNRNLHVLYRCIFSALKLKYYDCFARYKYDGALEMDYVAYHHVTDMFYAIPDETGHQRFVYPATLRFNYEFDELPSGLEGTNIILISKKNANALKSDIQKVSIAPTTGKANFLHGKYQLTFDADGKTIHSKNYEMYSGIMSTHNRKRFLEYAETKNFNSPEDSINDAKIDTFYINQQDKNYPYRFAIDYETTSKGELQEIDKNVVSLNLKSYIHNKVVECKEEKRYLDYYPEYKYDDEKTYFITFNKPIEIVNADNLNKSLENDFGGYKMEIKKVNEQTLSITSSYKVKAFMLPKNKISQIKALFDLYTNSINSNLLVKEL